ncbi:unnamed protein product [Peniophora sp. CBMAI 1063]|nr:unnamed protein product [Peniophora sp. CBMAI 1063]
MRPETLSNALQRASASTPHVANNSVQPQANETDASRGKRRRITPDEEEHQLRDQEGMTQGSCGPDFREDAASTASSTETDGFPRQRSNGPVNWQFEFQRIFDAESSSDAELVAIDHYGRSLSDIARRTALIAVRSTLEVQVREIQRLIDNIDAYEEEWNFLVARAPTVE